MGICVENQGENMVALRPKCYTFWNGDVKTAEKKKMKLKGLNLERNWDKIQPKQYLDIIQKGGIEKGTNANLLVKEGEMVKIFTEKNGLTGAHTKMYVFDNQTCAPLIKGVKYDN